MAMCTVHGNGHSSLITLYVVFIYMPVFTRLHMYAFKVLFVCGFKVYSCYFITRSHGLTQLAVLYTKLLLMY